MMAYNVCGGTGQFQLDFNFVGTLSYNYATTENLNEYCTANGKSFRCIS